MIRVQYAVDRATIQLHGEIDVSTALELTAEIALCVDYYKLPLVDLQLDSPGGSSDAALYLLDRFAAWRAGGLTIATLGLTIAASAGALLLSAGSIGHRRTLPMTRLLYHHARLLAPTGAVLTREQLTAHQARLAEVDQRAIRALAEHAFDGVRDATGGRFSVRANGATEDIRDPDHLASIYHDLARVDAIITPQAAIAYGLIDRIEAPGGGAA